jgi:hypothetical protein
MIALGPRHLTNYTTSNVKLSSEKVTLEERRQLHHYESLKTRRENMTVFNQMGKENDYVFRKKLKRILNFRYTFHSAKSLHTIPSATFKQGQRFPCPRHEGIWGSGGIVPLILNFGTRWSKVVNALAALPRQRSQYPLNIK